MASHHGHTHSEPAKMEQIITEFFAKSLHIILESRCPYVSSRNYSGEQVLSSPSPSSSTSSSSSFRPRDKWFNLALRDCPAALENIDFWRQSNLEPMIVDVILMQWPNDWDPLNFSPKGGLERNFSRKERDYFGLDNDEFGSEGKSEKIIERWVLQYESKKSGGNGSGSSGSKRSNSISSHALYKKSILLLRSLYATVRLLPAYKLFRDLISTAQIRLYNLGHRVSSFVEPFTRREEADMQRFVFTPIETSCGRLCLSVLYRSSVMDVSSEPSTPISPQFIPEYVGSPMAEPLKRFPSGLVSHSSPSLSPFGRRHSWSYDLYRASPLSMYPSPSPTYSESHAKHCLPPAGLPRHLHDETAAAHKNNPSYDEYWNSTMFSPSPSPSPPTYVPDSLISKSLLRSESAPVSIPASRLSSMPSLPNKQLMLPSPPMKATRLNVSKKVTNLGLQQTTSTVDKLFSFGKGEPGKMVVKPSSHSSPSKSFSRSSSRLSFQDDYDDTEFSGPFIVDDDDMIDPGSRPSSFELQGHPSGPHEPGEVFPAKKSQDAAVGALVCMLKKAPPLRQDISVTTQYLQGSKLQALRNYMQNANEISNSEEQTIGVQPSTSLNLASSGLIASKTTADALDELRGYRELKDLLLMQGKNSQA
ncbi:autophagy-related protein 13 [Phtheirospermum japonicum]|uniref:Autophagy-related protein 13 n=1 Tax=Phtheirospermum japonicum TaxID=374723 RepID=A0A830CAX8_9LAMI|nr:autophagy-related protein 13 [Phtheirospermum japonicum]